MEAKREAMVKVELKIDVSFFTDFSSFLLTLYSASHTITK